MTLAKFNWQNLTGKIKLQNKTVSLNYTTKMVNKNWQSKQPQMKLADLNHQTKSKPSKF